MTNLLFNFYRLKIIEPSQMSLPFEKGMTNEVVNKPVDEQAKKRDIILQAISEKPTNKLKNGQQWRIGNVEQLLDDKLDVFFALGKTTKATHHLFDKNNGNFIEETIDEAPHTFAVVDLINQVCAIAQKSIISTSTDNIAKNLVRLLDQTSVACQNDIKFTLGKINDPETFIDLIENAHRITSFEMTFNRPNPFDAEEQFQKPMEKFTKETDASEGKASVRGKNLNKGIITELARSTASTGNEAKARIQSTSDSTPILKKLSGTQTKVTVDIGGENYKDKLIKSVREKYNKIRGSDTIE